MNYSANENRDRHQDRRTDRQALLIATALRPVSNVRNQRIFSCDRQLYIVLYICPSVCHRFFTNSRSSDFYKIIRKHWKHLLASRSSDQNIQRLGRGGHFCVNFGRFRKFLSCPLCGSLPISPIRFICGTNKPVGRRYVERHFRVQRSRSHRSFVIMDVSTL